jgi:hypothetical protein
MSQARAVVETLLPAEGPLPGGMETGADVFLQEFLRTAPLSMILAARAAIFAAGWVSPVLIFRLPPLSRLSSGDRERALAAMAGSRSAVLRQLVLLLKATLAFNYGADPKVRAAIRFPKQ